MAAALERVIWVSGCAWQCLPPYTTACVTCSERNALSWTAAPALPANASWDDSGGSGDCTGWRCNAGLLPRADASACVPYAALRQTCAAYFRCATRAADPNCVWCPAAGGCLPSRLYPVNRTGCRLTPDGSGRSRCDYEAGGCLLECAAHGCGRCLQDPLCGW